MNRSSAVAVASMLVALFAVLTALFAVFRPGTVTPEARGATAARNAAVQEQQLLVHMVLYQRYAEKAQAAAEADNWPLAAFYTSRIQDNTSRLVDSRILLRGIDISQIAAEVAVPRAANLRAAARAGDRARFDSAYALLIDGCNACHKRSGHRYIQVGVPSGAAPIQSFAPIPGLRPE